MLKPPENIWGVKKKELVTHTKKCLYESDKTNALKLLLVKIK